MMLPKALGGALLMVATWFLIFVIVFLAEPARADGKACMIASGSDFSGAPNA